MSRFILDPQNYPLVSIAYGFDNTPLGGYFVQVFDENEISENNEEGIILNEGFCPGINHGQMSEIMSNLIYKYKIEVNTKLKNHLLKIALDLAI